MEHNALVQKEDNETPLVLGLEMALMPSLRTCDIRAGTAGLLVDMNELVDERLRFENGMAEGAEQGKIQRALLKVTQFVSEVAGVDDDKSDSRHLKKLGLEHIPEDVFLALLHLCQEVPGVYEKLMRDPMGVNESDTRPGDYHLFFVMFQGALGSVAGAERVTLRHVRAAKLLDLQREVPAHTVDQNKPYPVDMDRVARADVEHGALALHEMFERELQHMPGELREHAQCVMDFLIECLDPSDNARLGSLLDWPQHLHLGELPLEVIDAASRVKFFDHVLHLAMLGHSEAWADRGLTRLASPLRYNPISIAMQNSAKRKDGDLSSIREIYSLSDLSLLPAHMQSEIQLVSANQRAEIGGIVKDTLALGFFERSYLFLKKIYDSPLLLFSKGGLMYKERKERNRALERRRRSLKWNITLNEWDREWQYFDTTDTDWKQKRVTLYTTWKQKHATFRQIFADMAEDPLLPWPIQLPAILHIKPDHVQERSSFLSQCAKLILNELKIVDPNKAKSMSGDLNIEELASLCDYISNQHDLLIAFPHDFPSIRALHYDRLELVKMRPKDEKNKPKKIHILPHGEICEIKAERTVGSKLRGIPVVSPAEGDFEILSLLPSERDAAFRLGNALILVNGIVHCMDRHGESKPFFDANTPLGQEKYLGLLPLNIEKDEFLSWGENFIRVSVSSQSIDGIRRSTGVDVIGEVATARDGSFVYTTDATVTERGDEERELCFVYRKPNGSYTQTKTWPLEVPAKGLLKMMSYRHPKDIEMGQDVQRYRVASMERRLHYEDEFIFVHSDIMQIFEIGCRNGEIQQSSIQIAIPGADGVCDFALLPDGRVFVLYIDSVRMFSVDGGTLSLESSYKLELLLRDTKQTAEAAEYLKNYRITDPRIINQGRFSDLQVMPNGDIYFTIDKNLFKFTGEPRA